MTLAGRLLFLLPVEGTTKVVKWLIGIENVGL